MIEQTLKNNIQISKYDWFNIYTFKNDLMGKDIANGKCWEPHIVKFLNNNLTKESTFIDVGSNYGWHSIIASKLCKEVHSFEPQKVMCEIQKMSILENNLENCHIYDIALGETTKDAKMVSINYLQEGINIGDLSLGSDGESIRVKTIDSFNFNRIDVIKIDVQGYETFVLDGALESIKQHKPIMIIEFENFQMSKFSYSPKELFNKIKELDYEIYFLEYSYPSDHVCIHKSMVNNFEKNNTVVTLSVSNDLNNNLDNGITKKII